MKKEHSIEVMEPIKSLELLRARKRLIRAELDKSEEKLGDIWNDVFHSQEKEETNSPTMKAMAFITSAAGVIDGVVLGWKLYRKLGGSFHLFGKKKKKKK